VNPLQVKLLLEAGLALLVVWWTLRYPDPAPFVRKIRPRSSGPVSDVMISGILSLMISISISVMRPPTPEIHDEFSYLLAADTFASGRLCNETHPCWRHFESMHILQQPRYASKYPPLQGLFMAFGQWCFETPIAGVWLSTAMAAAATCWMLQGWTRRRWALVGGLLMAFHSGLQLVWGQSFMGGAVAAIGGCLVYGALGRWLHHPTASAGILGASGLAILANSRPFEGLLVSLPALLVLVLHGFSYGTRITCRTLLISLLPGVVVLGISAAAMLRYNKEVTGSMLTMPYSLHTRQYMAGPIFIWQKPPSPTPHYGNVTMKEFHQGWETDSYTAQKSVSGFLTVKSHYIGRALFILLSPLTLIAVVTGAWYPWPNQPFRRGLILTSLSCLIIGASTTVWLFPHYLAPGFPLLMIFSVRGIRQLYVSRIPHPGIPGGIDGDFLFSASASIVIISFFVHAGLHVMEEPAPWAADRTRFETQLTNSPGEDLVIVTYSAEHSPHDEWVYNRAEIDGAPVVWARDLGTTANAQLITYFDQRKVWILQADVLPRVLEAHPDFADR
jgi:hypothetical protein